MALPLCQQCGAEIPPRGRPGNPRRYCSARCRTEAYRDRQAGQVAWAEIEQPPREVAVAQVAAELLEVAESVIEEQSSAPPGDRLARAIVETRVLSRQYGQLAPELPPGLAWRAEDMSTTLDRSVDRLFGAPDD